MIITGTVQQSAALRSNSLLKRRCNTSPNSGVAIVDISATAFLATVLVESRLTLSLLFHVHIFIVFSRFRIALLRSLY